MITEHGQTEGEVQPAARTALRRRGLIAAAAALMAGIAAKQTAPHVEATDFNLIYSNDPTLETIAFPAAPIFIQSASPFTTTFPRQIVQVAATTAGVDAIIGDASGGGRNGVLGMAASGIGVNAGATSGTALNAGSNTGPAVNAGSGGNHGVSGTTTAAHYAGVVGYTSTPTASGIGGIAYDPAAFAASFTGTVSVTGTLVVNGVVKSAINANGALRLLSSMESPEAWVEDFGEGTLAGNKAAITLDPGFAATVDTAVLHVFLTPHTPQHLHVPERTATGFTVVAAPLATAGGPKPAEGGGTFSWRVVARRKGVTEARLATWTPPAPLPKPLPVSPAQKLSSPTKQP